MPALEERAALTQEINDFRKALPGNREVNAPKFIELCSLIGRAKALYGGDIKAVPTLTFNHLHFLVDVAFADDTLPSISFQACQFHKKVTFTHVTFANDLAISASHFHRSTEFSGCIFSDRVNADDVQFRSSVDFSRSKFSENLYMRKAEFRQEARFAYCLFSRNSYFHDTQFHSQADFSFARFFSVWFNNALFKEATSFSGAQFRPWAPQFHNAQLHHDTSFAGAIFDAYEHEQDWRAYRTLKQKMSEVRAQEEESFFFAAEQRARRRFRPHYYPAWSDYFTRNGFRLAGSRLWDALTTLNPHTAVARSSFNTVVSFFYDYVSNYGQNIARPFLWWLLQYFTFAGIYLGHANQIASSASWINSSLAREPLLASVLSLQNSLNPLALFSREPLVTVTSLPMFLVAVTQAIASIVFLALALLAIRRRFHKGSE